jgi:hypothetical protein
VIDSFELERQRRILPVIATRRSMIAVGRMARSRDDRTYTLGHLENRGPIGLPFWR